MPIDQNSLATASTDAVAQRTKAEELGVPESRIKFVTRYIACITKARYVVLVRTHKRWISDLITVTESTNSLKWLWPFRRSCGCCCCWQEAT